MFIIGTVAGPKDNELLKWAEHWKDRGRLLIVVQGKPDWLKSPLAKQLFKIAPDADVYPVLPVGNPDLHWNTLMAMAANIPDSEGLLIKGTDEYMTDPCWDKMQKAVRNQPEAAVFWVFRKDFYDGHHFESMPGDMQPTLVRGLPMQYGVQFHSYPNPTCSVDVIRHLPVDIYVEHRRSLKRVIAVNRQREQIARPHEAGVQYRFLTRLQEACKAKGVEWPEVSK